MKEGISLTKYINNIVIVPFFEINYEYLIFLIAQGGRNTNNIFDRSHPIPNEWPARKKGTQW